MVRVRGGCTKGVAWVPSLGKILFAVRVLCVKTGGFFLQRFAGFYCEIFVFLCAIFFVLCFIVFFFCGPGDEEGGGYPFVSPLLQADFIFTVQIEVQFCWRGSLASTVHRYIRKCLCDHLWCCARRLHIV